MNMVVPLWAAIPEIRPVRLFSASPEGSDPELEAHEAYGAWGTKVMYGNKVQGVIRSTFLVSPDGKIAQAWRGVKVDGHVDKVLAAIEEQRA